MRKISFAFIFLFVFSISSASEAFDNQRDGFILGGIGGVSVNLLYGSENGNTNNSETLFAVHTDLRIGGGSASNKSLLYFWNKMNWSLLKVEGDEDIYVYDERKEKILFPSGIAGIGSSYYFRPSSPSLYLNGGVGISLPLLLGFGLMGGVGYEFARHWSFECGIMWSRLFSLKLFDIDLAANTFTINVSIIGIAY
jgi:hypothetical protein